MVLIGDLVREFVAQKPIEEGLLRCRVYEAWDALMAEALSGSRSAKEAAKLTLRKYYADGTLTCKMASSMVRMHLQMEAEALRLRLNDRLGEPLVTKIVLQ